MIKKFLKDILSYHRHDKEQLKVIKSKKDRFVIEAPAGYGKTTTMQSQIAYLILSGKLPNPKKILGLTFSVAAANNMKEAIRKLENELAPIPKRCMENRLYITNYHGFCRRTLKLYGYLIDERLRKIEELRIVKEEKEEKDEKYKFLSEFLEEIKNQKANTTDNSIIKEKIEEYNSEIKKTLLEYECFSYNAIITFTLELFEKFPKLKEFFQKLYPAIFVDEFQDTNILGWKLIESLVSEKTKLYIYGDSFQTIYSFMGSLNNVMDKACEKYKAEKIEFRKNYRFSNNKQMLNLEQSLRNFMKDINLSSENQEKVQIKLYLAENQEKEAEFIVSKCIDILKNDKNAKIAILTRQRGENIRLIVEKIKNNNIGKFFYGLLTETDVEYTKFHDIAYEIFLKELKLNNELNKNFKVNENFLEAILTEIKSYYNMSVQENYIFSSLFKLLEAFFKKVMKIHPESRIEVIRETLLSKSLNRYISEIDDNIMIVTIHGAKGLEWDYVFIPDLEYNSIPSWSLCNKCIYREKDDCPDFQILYKQQFNTNLHQVIEEFNILYVALTRAKKENIYTASKANGSKTKISCFLKIPVIDLKVEEVR